MLRNGTITLRSFAISFCLIFGAVIGLGLLPQEKPLLFEAPPPAVDSETSILPSRVQIAVPFALQAPFADWGYPYQEACEEAALLMVHAFLTENKLTPDVTNNQLLSLIAWEEQRGYAEDVPLAETAEIAEAYYGYQTTIIENPSIEDIQSQIAQGNPVIVPAAGRMLGNPYFSGEGPWYHMLVITGYNSKWFITNDPGTKRGEEYRYAKNVLMEAIHDWTGVKEEIQEGRKVALVITKKSG